MEILNGIIAEESFIYLEKYKTLIISDIHIGYEEALNRKGILLPKTNYKEIIHKIEKTISNIQKNNSIDKIVLNGDLIHEFGKKGLEDKHLIKKFLETLSNYGKIVVIEGNHDNFLKFTIDKKIVPKKEIIFGEILIMHGDKLPELKTLKKIKTIIIGHEHPAIALKSGLKIEKYKCFLKGKYKSKNLIIMPSCNTLIEGTDILSEKTLSPFLKDNNIKELEIYILGDKIYYFGKIKHILKKINN